MSHLKRRSLSTRLTSLAVLCTAVVAALSTEARAEEPAAVRTVPVIWSDFRIGLATPFPRESIARDFSYEPHHIVREAYLLHSGPNHDRPSWDLTSVLQAIRPFDGYFDLSAAGRVHVDDDGFTRFEPQPGGRDRYLILHDEQIPRVVATQRALASQPPSRRCPAGTP